MANIEKEFEAVFKPIKKDLEGFGFYGNPNSKLSIGFDLESIKVI